MFKKTLLITVLFYLFFSCNNSTQGEKEINNSEDQTALLLKRYDSIAKLNDSLKSINTVLSTKNDSLIRLINNYAFHKDSCIFQGKLKLKYSLLGHPYIPGKKYPTEKEFFKNIIFKLLVYTNKNDDLVNESILNKQNKFSFKVKLKKNRRFHLVIFSRKNSEKKFHLESVFYPGGIKTTTKDTIKHDINIIRFRT